MRKIYWRCNNGHYFSTPHCPFDGWSSSGLQQLFEIVSRSPDQGQSVTIEDLRARGLSQELLDKVIIIEFGGERSVFEGFEPTAYVIEGQHVPLRKLSREYL